MSPFPPTLVKSRVLFLSNCRDRLQSVFRQSGALRKDCRCDYVMSRLHFEGDLRIFFGKPFSDNYYVLTRFAKTNTWRSFSDGFWLPFTDWSTKFTFYTHIDRSLLSSKGCLILQ